MDAIRWRRSLALVAGALLAAGCTSLASTDDLASASAASPARPTVVAMIDMEANPYHVSVAATTTAVEDHAGAWGATPVTLSSEGSWDERRAADDAFWSSVVPGELYAFHGTRLLGISMREGPGPHIVGEFTNGHGTATTSVLAREDPTALIVLVQVTDLVVCPEDPCVIPPSFTRAMDWIADQPWIDVVSVSLALPGNPYLPPELEEGTGAYRDATQRAAASGKMIVLGAGNLPTPTPSSPMCGPPEVIAVGGAEPAHHAERVESAKLVDVVSNYTAYVAEGLTLDEYYWTVGTSFATPTVAGALSRAIFDTRAALGQTTGIVEGRLVDAGAVQRTSADFRNAMNASAILWGPTDFSPLEPNSNDTITQLTTFDVPVLSPTQMGWGYVDHEVSREIAARVLAGDYSIPASKAEAAAFQAQFQAARERIWA